MNTLKRIALSFVFVCALAVSSFGQSASDCTISGNLYDSFNDPLVGFTFTATVTRRDGVPVAYSPKSVTTTSGGAISFTVPRKSFVLIRGSFTVGRYDFRNGLLMFIPDEASKAITDLQSVEDAAAALVAVSAAPSDAQYVVGAANGTLSAEQSLGALTTGLLKNTVSGSTGALSTATAGTDYENPLTFAARLNRSTNTIDLANSGVTAGTCTNCDLTIDTYGRVTAKANGSGGGGAGTWGSITGTLSSQTDLQSALDLKAPLISPSFTTPTLGVASATSVNKVAITAPATSATLAIADGKTLTASNTITFTATDGSTLGIGTGGTLGSAAYTASSAYEVPLTFSTGLTRSTNTITVNTSQNIATLSNLTSNGIVTTSGGAGTLGVTVPGTGVLTALAVNTGSSGAFVVNGGALGTPSSGTLTNATGLPISTGVSGLGTGIATALAVNTGSAGAPVLFNGAGGTPSSLTLTNATGLPTTGISGWPANASGVLTNNGSGTLSWAAAGGGITIGTTTITSGTNTRVLYNNSGVVGEYAVTGTGNAVLSASPTLTGTLTAALADFAGAARSSGVASYFRIQTPADTAQTASTESIGSQFGGNSSAATVTRQWSTGALTTQRENVFVAPTYAFVGASTITTAATVAITGAPAAGTNATITNPYALWVQSGNVRFAGSRVFLNGTASTDVTIESNGSIGEGTLAVGSGATGTLAAAVMASGFYANQFNNNNTSITVAIKRDTGITLGNDKILGWQSSASGAFNASADTGFIRSAAAVVRVTNGSTGSGNLLLGTSTVGSIGTSGVGVLAIANGAAPTSSPADEFQLYSADSAAGDANAFARNEAGEINRLTGLTARNSAQFDKTSDTTLANVTGLTRNVEAGRTYAFTAVLYTTSNVAGGVKAAIGGTATATSIVYEAEVKDGSTFATMGTSRATSLATTVGDVTAVTAARITISGTIVVNAAGTLTVQFAQNASNGSASSVLVNSSFQLIPIS